MTRIAFIGGGNMARSLIGGLLATGHAAADIRVADPLAETRERLGRDFGVATFAENRLAVADADVILLAVKPQAMPKVQGELRLALQGRRPLMISIAAGVRLDQLERWLGALPIVRCMPNTPALIGAGATGLCANGRVSPAQKAQAQHILAAAGLTRWIADEALMDTVTALSGSGPAYFFALVEALEDAAVAQGLPRDTARALAAQTCLGAGRMLTESGEDPAELRRRVTSPNGTTQAALESFAADGLPRIAARAVAAATRRGAELAAALDQESHS
jgi:pyrroline-5-carboxylate reductase